MIAKLLLVDDDITFVDAVKASLRSDKRKIIVASTYREAIELFGKHEREFDCVVLDENLPDGKGHSLAQLFRQMNPRIEVLFATQDSSQETLDTLLETGCASFIRKGKNGDFIRATINSAISRFQKSRMLLKRQDDEDIEKVEQQLRSINMVSRHPSMVDVYTQIKTTREQRADTLILGETGVGKELVARAIANGRGPFVAVNASSYPGADNFAERDFCGSVKSAFTGAADQPGFFDAAKGGTLFIDEIHGMNHSGLRMFLRVLQQKTYKRMGDSSGREFKIDCQIIYGGKAELQKLVESGAFVEDLYYRIKRNIIHVLPLRERKEDIEPLVRHFTEIYNKRFQKKRYFKSDTLPVLQSLPWPGNIRDLENLVSDLILHSTEEIISTEQLTDYLKRATAFGFKEKARSKLDLNILSDSFNESHIKAALRASTTMSDAAEALAIPRTTLYNRCKKLNINPDIYLNQPEKE